MPKFRKNDHVIINETHLNKDLHGSVFTIDDYIGNSQYVTKESSLFVFLESEMDSIRELNPESMSWGEWVDAAGKDPSKADSTDVSIWYKAWKLGEDPSEYI
jgi:hypothetical protein